MNNEQHQYSRRAFIKRNTTIALSSSLAYMSIEKVWAAKDNNTKNLTPDTELNNGIRMPMLGFGTLSLTNTRASTCVAKAIECGYRHIDTATLYKNEDAVGEGLRTSGIDRKKLFITSKVWVADSGYEKTLQAFDRSLNSLGTDYLDLYLIHRPRGDVQGSWQALEKLYKQGKITAIGISNFDFSQYNHLKNYAKVKPAVHQIETHAYFHQNDAYEHLKKEGIQMEAWSPFAQGRSGLFEDKTLAKIGKSYGKTNAQISLRWHFQRGIIAIPRSSKVEHMKENLNIFDFTLSDQDMKNIEQLDLNKTQFPTWR